MTALYVALALLAYLAAAATAALLLGAVIRRRDRQIPHD